MIIVAFLLGWLAIGFALGLYEARRGHWRWLWLLGAIAGPFAIPLSRQIEENEDLARPIPVAGGSWSVDNEYDDGQGNTYREVWTGTFTSATTVEGTISYSVAGNGSYCQTGTVEWSGAPA